LDTKGGIRLRQSHYVALNLVHISAKQSTLLISYYKILQNKLDYFLFI